MTVWCYIHSIAKRAKITALVDSGATENFMNLTYAKWLCLLIKRLSNPRKLFNVDGMENKAGELFFYMDLQVQSGGQNTALQFFLSDLGEHKAILGYSWFVAIQPRIDWKKGWIDHTQLPIILRAPNMQHAQFVPRTCNIPRMQPPNWYYIGHATIHPYHEQKCTTESDLDKIPKEFHQYSKVFSEEKSQCLPHHTIWDHAIELLPNTPATLPGRLLPLTKLEKEEMQKFVEEHLQRGTICESWSPYAVNFFFVKKKDGKLWPVQDSWPNFTTTGSDATKLQIPRVQPSHAHIKHMFLVMWCSRGALLPCSQFHWHWIIFMSWVAFWLVGVAIWCR